MMNKPTNSSITRRNFLASRSALLTLPALESMNSLSAAPTLAKPPTRMIFCGVGYGFNEKTFYPTEASPVALNASLGYSMPGIIC